MAIKGSFVVDWEENPLAQYARNMSRYAINASPTPPTPRAVVKPFSEEDDVLRKINEGLWGRKYKALISCTSSDGYDSYDREFDTEEEFKAENLSDDWDCEWEYQDENYRTPWGNPHSIIERIEELGYEVNYYINYGNGKLLAGIETDGIWSERSGDSDYNALQNAAIAFALRIIEDRHAKEGT